ncbi:hypothetical protein FACS1894193_09760 [Bacilli bacterium]|nr:hypothetical protein FACS1894192_09990 [Bacilli bacterium]GHU43227.1 hypothetical protein FACS1894193_09760 [Bacilli bacterium]
MKKNEGCALVDLENYYQELLRGVKATYPEIERRMTIVIQAKLITTKLSDEEKSYLEAECFEIARKIKAVKESICLLDKNVMQTYSGK